MSFLSATDCADAAAIDREFWSAEALIASTEFLLERKSPAAVSTMATIEIAIAAHCRMGSHVDGRSEFD
ncbi:hypothetical protein DVB88_00820 [Tsukamurella pulmonis]|nr:hypothetical protein DVB88_00820 [Tsukamurella pulmonis]